MSTYSFEEHKNKVQFRVLDIDSGQSSLLFEDNKTSGPVWLDDDKYLFLRSVDRGTTLLADSVSSPVGAL